MRWELHSQRFTPIARLIDPVAAHAAIMASFAQFCALADTPRFP
jgi:hypothetical protein